MEKSLKNLIEQLNKQPKTVEFEDVMKVISDNFEYTPTQFSNGNVVNEAGTNEGSCKIFAFAKLANLTPEQTLHCFGRYYRQDVLENPEGEDHANIRNFIKYGWDKVSFEHNALTEKG